MRRNGISYRREVGRVRSGGKDGKPGTAAGVIRPETEMEKLLDLRRLILPFTLLEITHGFRKLQQGEILQIVGTNPDFRKDILKVLKTLPCELLYIGHAKNGYFIRLRKLGESEAQK